MEGLGQAAVHGQRQGARVQVIVGGHADDRDVRRGRVGAQPAADLAMVSRQQIDMILSRIKSGRWSCARGSASPSTAVSTW
jgi:hypothetical protein